MHLKNETILTITSFGEKDERIVLLFGGMYWAFGMRTNSAPLWVWSRREDCHCSGNTSQRATGQL